MELSLSSTSCIPISSKLKHKHVLFHSQFPTSTASTKTRKTKPLFIVNASRPTLSSNWLVSPDDLSASTASPWLPRIEELDTTNMLLRQRIIFLGSQVDDMTADFIISQLLLLDAEDSKKDIKLFINSPGGSVTAGMGIYDAMKLCKADVSTVCLGLAASMGAFILASGTKGKRYCMPNSRVMIHQPLGTAGGKATDMSIRIREMAYHKIKINKILSRITGKALVLPELLSMGPCNTLVGFHQLHRLCFGWKRLKKFGVVFLIDTITSHVRFLGHTHRLRMKSSHVDVRNTHVPRHP